MAMMESVATRAGRLVPRARFRADAAALALRLPTGDYVLNACADRYRFLVGLAAALQRRQISLLPANHAPAMLQALAEDYPGLYALTDGADLPLPGFAYPDDLAGGAAVFDLDALPLTQPAIILFTSGSTGRPKPVRKSWGTLVRSAISAGCRLEVARLRGATLIGTVPHQHSYGLESILMLGLLHGLVMDTSMPCYPGDIRAALERAPRPRILVTAPVHLRALLAAPAGLPPVDLIVCATAPLPASLAVQAEACFGGPLIEIYGCTEAGQVATRRTAQGPAWHCLEGVNINQDQAGSWASGAAVEGVAPLHDAIELIDDQHFMLGDRAADLVDVAGKRTSLAYLNHQLLGIAGVRDGAFVVQAPDGGRVARLMALAVAPELSAEAILRALRARIDTAFLPRPLILLEQLPRDALGKLPREALLRLAGRAEAA